MIKVLNLKFLNTTETIAAFLVETSVGPILLECGPHSVFTNLEAELIKHNYKISDIKHLFLTHIHFDHAGAAWALAKQGAQVYVHPHGYKHLLDPSRLYGSAKRIYGDKMEFLWGKMEGIPENLLQTVEHQEVIKIGDTEIKSLHTPGHAVHHIAWQIDDMLIAGDVAGCKISDGPVVPPCPPPDIDIEAWENSIDIILESGVKSLFLTHYGEVTEVEDHLEDLRKILWDWAHFIKPYFDKKADIKTVIPEFAAYAKQQLIQHNLDTSLIQKYENANPAWMSVAGLMRYWAKKAEG